MNAIWLIRTKKKIEYSKDSAEQVALFANFNEKSLKEDMQHKHNST